MREKEEQDFLWNMLDEHFAEYIEDDDKEYSLPSEVDKFIIDKIKEALKECNNNKTYAAKRLGIKRETLLAKIKKYML